MKSFALLTAAAAILNVTPARADLIGHYDVLAASNGSQIITGYYDDQNNVAGFSQRVFMGDLQATIFAGDEPGFRGLSSPPGGVQPLPGSTQLRARFLPMTVGAASSNLFYWDGVGPVTFTNAPSGYAFTATGDGGSTGLADGTDTTSSDFLLRQTSSTGFLHKHPDYELTSGGLGDPAGGFYLVSMQLTMPGSGLTDSLPIYMVFATSGADEDAHAAAASWASDNLAAVPEPATVVLTGLPLLGVAFIWGRRRLRAFWLASRPAPVAA